LKFYIQFHRDFLGRRTLPENEGHFEISVLLG